MAVSVTHFDLTFETTWGRTEPAGLTSEGCYFRNFTRKVGDKSAQFTATQGAWPNFSESISSRGEHETRTICNEEAGLPNK